MTDTETIEKLREDRRKLVEDVAQLCGRLTDAEAKLVDCNQIVARVHLAETRASAAEAFAEKLRGDLAAAEASIRRQEDRYRLSVSDADAFEARAEAAEAKLGESERVLAVKEREIEYYKNAIRKLATDPNP